MKKLSNPFQSHLPICDLHGEITETVPIVLNRFIEEQLKYQQTEFIIIHGIGEGIVKNATHEYLKENKQVKDFYQDQNNQGITCVKLRSKE